MLFWVIFVLQSINAIARSNSTAHEIFVGDNLVNNALLHVFEPDKVKIKLKKVYEKSKNSPPNFEHSRIRRRCTDYFAWYYELLL